MVRNAEVECSRCHGLFPGNVMKNVTDRVRSGETVTPVRRIRYQNDGRPIHSTEQVRQTHYADVSSALCPSCASKRRTNRVIGAGLLGVTALFGVAMCSDGSSTNDQRTEVHAAANVPERQIGSDTDEASKADAYANALEKPADSSQGSLDAAFTAAFGSSQSATIRRNGEDGPTEYTVRPEKLFWLPRGPVLLSIADDGSAPQWRKVVIHYLRINNGVFSVDKSWFDVGSAGSDPSISDKFSDYPIIYSEGMAFGAGGSESFFELTELRPDGPHMLGSFNQGSSTDGDDKLGRFGSISKGVFDLVCPKSGGQKVIRYHRVADSFVSSDPDGESGCSSD